MGVKRWGAFIEKNGLSEETILRNIGYSTEEIIINNLEFTSAIEYYYSKVVRDSEIFTFSTSKDYLILLDLKYSRIGGNIEDAKKNAKYFKYNNLYKFEYNDDPGIETFAQITKGSLRRYIHRAYYGEFEYGESVEIEPSTKKSYFTENLFGEEDKIIAEKHNSFIVLNETIGNMFKRVTGKYYQYPDSFDFQKIKLDKRIVKRVEPVRIIMDK